MAVVQPWNRQIFSGEKIIQLICEKIVIPHISLSDSDLENFEMNGEDYVKFTLSSRSGGRRSTVCEFVQALCIGHQEMLSAVLSKFSDSLMVEYNKNPAQNWRAKDIAMYVIIALAVQGQTMRRGCTKVNENLFPKDANGKHPGLWSFFEQHVLPELNQPIAR